MEIARTLVGITGNRYTYVSPDHTRVLRSSDFIDWLSSLAEHLL